MGAFCGLFNSSTFHDEYKGRVKEMALGNVSYNTKIMTKGLIPIQMEAEVEAYLEKLDPLWMIATCEHNLSPLGDVTAGSLVGLHWLEHLCPESGDSGELLRQVTGMLFSSTFLVLNEIDQEKRDHLLKELQDHDRAGWELLYLVCKFLGIPAMFLLNGGVFVTQDQVFEPHCQRAIFVCRPGERIRVLRPRFHNLYGIYSWTTEPTKVRESASQGGKGKGKKSSRTPKRKRVSETLLERTRDLLEESAEQEEQPPAKRSSLSGEGETSGDQSNPTPEITVTAAETTDTPAEITTKVTTPAGGVVTPSMVVVSEGEQVGESRSEEAEPQQGGTPTKTEGTRTTSTVSFMPGELHREKGPASHTSGASQGSFISETSMLLGRGRGRIRHSAGQSTVTAREVGGRDGAQSPKQGVFGEYRGTGLQPGGSQHELLRARETIRDLETQVGSLTGINSNLEIKLDSHRVLVQDYEADQKRIKLENASVRAQLMASERMGQSTERLLLEAQGKLRKAGSEEIDNLKRIAESRADQLLLLQTSLEAYKKALNEQIANYHRLCVYTLAMERHCLESAFSMLKRRIPWPNDLLPPSAVELHEGPIQVQIMMPIPVVPVPVTAATPAQVAVTTAATTVAVTTQTGVSTTTAGTATPTTSKGVSEKAIASGSGQLRATMVNRPLIPVPPTTTPPVVFPTPVRVPVMTSGGVNLTRVLGAGVPTASGIVRPIPRAPRLVPILPTSPRTRMSTVIGVMAGGVVAPTVKPTASGRGQSQSPTPGPSRDVRTPPQTTPMPEDDWSMPPAVMRDPRPTFQPPVAGPRPKTPGKKGKRKDPSPAKVRGRIDPDEGSAIKGKWHSCSKCPHSGMFAVHKEFAAHMFHVHSYNWVCPMCARIMPDKGKFNFHVQRIHGIPGRTYPCHFPGCGKTFSTAHYLMDHLPIHGREHACSKCGRGHRKRTDCMDHERQCEGPFNHEEYAMLWERAAPMVCQNCHEIFMQVEYLAHLEACNRGYTEKKKGKRHPAPTVVEGGRLACPQTGEQMAGLPSMFVADVPLPSQLALTHEKEPPTPISSRSQGEVPQGSTRVEGRSNVATSKRKPTRRSVIPQKSIETIKLHSDEEDNQEAGGSSATDSEGDHGVQARRVHQRRVEQIFEEEG